MHNLLQTKPQPADLALCTMLWFSLLSTMEDENTQDQDKAVYNIVLSLKIHLNLMNFCIVCGVNLKERSDHDTKSNLVTSLNHILSSSCFLANSGPDKVKEIQLFQDGNEVTEVSTMLQSEQGVDTHKSGNLEFSPT